MSNAATQVQPYLFFNGRCEEALNFYREVFGAEITMMMRFKDSPEPPMVPQPSGENIMHAEFRIGDSLLMASDGDCSDTQNARGFSGFSLTVSARDAEEADRLFNTLAQGGQVQMPLGPTFFSPRFGAVADRFGVGWMVIVPQPMQ